MADGYDHIGLINCAGGILAQDYEMFEIHDPHLLLRHEYLPDSAGPGRWRGGMGVETEFLIQVWRMRPEPSVSLGVERDPSMT